MKLIIDISKEYYEVIKEIPNDTSTADMLIIKYGKPFNKELQEIRQEIAEHHAHNGNGDDRSIDCRLFNAGIQIALEIIDNKIKELSE